MQHATCNAPHAACNHSPCNHATCNRAIMKQGNHETRTGSLPVYPQSQHWRVCLQAPPSLLPSSPTRLCLHSQTWQDTINLIAFTKKTVMCHCCLLSGLGTQMQGLLVCFDTLHVPDCCLHMPHVCMWRVSQACARVLYRHMVLWSYTYWVADSLWPAEENAVFQIKRPTEFVV